MIGVPKTFSHNFSKCPEAVFKKFPGSKPDNEFDFPKNIDFSKPSVKTNTINSGLENPVWMFLPHHRIEKIVPLATHVKLNVYS